MKKLCLIILIILLCSCSTDNSGIRETVYGEYPDIVTSESEKEENMFWYAMYSATNDYLKITPIKYETALIGSKATVYIVDEAGNMREKGSPYYYPIILDDIPCGFVAVYNGENDLYTDYYYGGINSHGLSDEQMYAVCGDTGITTRDLNYDDQKNNRTYEFIDDLNKKYAVLIENDGSRYIITEDKTYDLLERKEAESDEYAEQIRQLLPAGEAPEFFRIPDEMIYENRTIHVVENKLSDKDRNQYKKAAKDFAGKFDDLKKATVGEMFNSWEVIVNTDLSRTVVSDINPAYFPVIMNDELVTVISVSSVNGSMECIGMPATYTLVSENWNSIKNQSFLVLRDNTFSHRNSVCLTNESIISPASGNGTAVPDIMNDVIEIISTYIGE